MGHSVSVCCRQACSCLRFLQPTPACFGAGASWPFPVPSPRLRVALGPRWKLCGSQWKDAGGGQHEDSFHSEALCPWREERGDRAGQSPVGSSGPGSPMAAEGRLPRGQQTSLP